jgi:hypothetical protein
MPRVGPSQLREFIESIRNYQSAESANLNHVGSATLSAVLELVEQIPGELLTMDKEAYGLLIRGKAQIKDTLATWIANRTAGHSLHPFSFHHSLNPLAQIRDAFAGCPDESPAPGTSELTFIPDADLRANLRNDIGAVTRALSNGEWKAATVLAGSAAEALLLWALKQRSSANITSAITALRASRELTTAPDPNNLDRWNLYEFIQVAEKL